MFTEEESRQQDAAFEAIKEEFSRLVKQEEAIRATLTDMGETLNPNEPVDPVVQKMMDEAQAKAKREGQLRAEEFQRQRHGASHAGSGKMPGQRRAGIVRV